LQTARDSAPQLGLLDLRLPDGDGVELAHKLAEQGAAFPLILMTAYPLRLRDQPELAQQFTRVMTKPLNLQELRQAIDSALTQTTIGHPAAPPIEPKPLTKPEFALSSTVDPLVPTSPAPRRRFVLLAVAILVLAALVALPALGIVKIPGMHKQEVAIADPEKSAAPVLATRPVDGDPDGLLLAPEVVKRLGLATSVVESGAATRPLQLSGTLNYNPDYLQRVHALFGGEVIQISEVDENTRGTTERRKLSFNDPVRKNDLLAVVWSKDLGQLKSTLVDALVRQRFDDETLGFYQNASNALSEAVIRQARAQVALDRNAAASAEYSLKVAKVPDKEIQAVKDEAKRIFDRRGEHDPETEKNWPRVEVRAGMDGILVEKNVVMGDTVDTAFNLFLIADLSKLSVWANAYEEDLRELNKVSRPYPWRVRLAADSRPGGQSDLGDDLKSPLWEKIAPAIDPNQHTATLMGGVDNPPSAKLHVGQMVSVAVNLPQPGNTVAVPVSALDEDGSDSVVFIQPNANKPYFSQRNVVVVQRLSDVVLVSSRLDDAERKHGLQALKQGDRVVTRQTYLLRAALQDLKGKAQDAKNQPNEGK
jgi:membrane fusion protein, heavy metal efflux system